MGRGVCVRCRRQAQLAFCLAADGSLWCPVCGAQVRPIEDRALTIQWPPPFLQPLSAALRRHDAAVDAARAPDPPADPPAPPDPTVPWVLTENDRRFLRQRGIAAD